jgi:hypothetical protein
MAEIIGFENSDFDSKRFDNIFGANKGNDVTTDGILDGWDNVKEILNDNIYDGIKNSPYYIKDTSDVK